MLHDRLAAAVQDERVRRARVERVRQVQLAPVAEDPGEGVVTAPEAAGQQQPAGPQVTIPAASTSTSPADGRPVTSAAAPKIS